MAGFFGLFDYTKEGPGVEKNERKKKGFFSFFEIYFRNFWQFVKVDFIYCLISLPLVTNGMAKAGLTHISRSVTREKHSFGLSDFFETVKKNWKQSLILGILNVVFTALLLFGLWFYWNSLNASFSAFNVIGLGVVLFLLICTTFMKYYIWTMVITFSLTIKQIIKNSFHFVFLNFWRNILISVTMGIIYALLAAIIMLTPGNGFCLLLSAAIFIFAVPGFKANLVQSNTFPVIKKYMIDPYYAEHKGEDIEKRKSLGLDVPEDEICTDKAADESIFSDERIQ